MMEGKGLGFVGGSEGGFQWPDQSGDRGMMA